MKTTLNCLLVLLLLSTTTIAQSTLSQKSKLIEHEGKMLYYSEKASWHGSDIFLEKVKNTDHIGGYFSYPYLDSVRCIFFSKAPDMKVVFTATFGKEFDLGKVNVSLDERFFTLEEHSLFKMRTKALEVLNTDTIFEFYQGTSPNLVPIINGGTKRVYVLTGPTKSGVVLFGNDYQLDFDKDNNLISITKLHNNLIPISTTPNEEGGQIVGTMHSHSDISSEFITPTDICTLMLYQYMTRWETHYVMSKEYVSIWDCKTNTLEIVTREDFKKKSENE